MVSLAMSHDGLLQQNLSPMLNPVRVIGVVRGTFHMFACGVSIYYFAPNRLIVHLEAQNVITPPHPPLRPLHPQEAATSRRSCPPMCKINKEKCVRGWVSLCVFVYVIYIYIVILMYIYI